MWWVFFGYPGSVAAAMTARLVVLLVAGPWLILAAASAPPSRTRLMKLAQVVVLALLLDRMMVDFRFWAPVALAVTAVGQAFKRGASVDAVVACLIAAFILLLLVMGLGPVRVVRYAALLLVIVGVLAACPAIGRRQLRPQVQAGAYRPAAGRRPWLGQLALCALAAWPLSLCVPEITWPSFPWLLMAGGGGWIGVQFVCWRAGRGVQRRRNWLRAGSWLSGLAAGLLFAALVGEAYFRYFYDASDANAELRTAQRWQQRHVQLNSWGYRDREFPPADQLDRLTRIVILGDSFAFGMGIDDPADLLGPRLEAALAGRVAPPPRVFTLARSGLDTRDELAMFQRDGVRLRPQVVVLMYHLNDTDKLVPWPQLRWSPALAWRPLTDNSDLLEFLHYRVFVRRQAAHMTVADLPGLAAYAQPAVFARQAHDLHALMSAIRQAGAVPVVLLYPYLNAPTNAGPQCYALAKTTVELAMDGVPVFAVSELVDVTDRRYHANRFDPHPSPALHAAVVPTLAADVIRALSMRPTSASATQPARP